MLKYSRQESKMLLRYLSLPKAKEKTTKNSRKSSLCKTAAHRENVTQLLIPFASVLRCLRKALRNSRRRCCKSLTGRTASFSFRPFWVYIKRLALCFQLSKFTFNPRQSLKRWIKTFFHLNNVANKPVGNLHPKAIWGSPATRRHLRHQCLNEGWLGLRRTIALETVAFWHKFINFMPHCR